MGVKAGWPDFYFRPEARKAIATLHFDGIYLKPNTEKTVLTAEYSGVLFGFGFMVRCPDGGIDHFYIRVKVDGRDLGQGAFRDHPLKAGIHQVQLHDPQSGRRRTLTVRIEPDRTRLLAPMDFQ